MTYIIDVDKIDSDNGYDEGYGHQCVALVKLGPPAAGSANPPQTSLWHPGIWVHTAPQGSIKKGTVIATFLDNMYPPGGPGKPRHAAVYLSHDDKGITVIDQWTSKPKPSNSRPLTFLGVSDRNVNNGDLYYVVELTTLPGQGGPCSPVEGSTGVDGQTMAK